MTTKVDRWGLDAEYFLIKGLRVGSSKEELILATGETWTRIRNKVKWIRKKHPDLTPKREDLFIYRTTVPSTIQVDIDLLEKKLSLLKEIEETKKRINTPPVPPPPAPPVYGDK